MMLPSDQDSCLLLQIEYWAILPLTCLNARSSTASMLPTTFSSMANENQHVILYKKGVILTWLFFSRLLLLCCVCIIFCGPSCSCCLGTELLFLETSSPLPPLASWFSFLPMSQQARKPDVEPMRESQICH